MPADVSLEDAIRRLYGEPPDSFVASRKALVAAAKAAGDKELATTIGGLRRPTAAAYLVNRLAADGSLDDLAGLGERFRQAQTELDAASMKSLGAERSSLIASLLAKADGIERLTASTREQLSQTFTAAIASPAAQEAVCSGALVSALSYSGFGDVELAADAVAHPAPRKSDNAGRASTGSSRGSPDADRGSANARAIAAAERAVTRAKQVAEKAADGLRTATERADLAQGSFDKARRTYESARSTLQDASDAKESAAQAAQEAADELADAEAILRTLTDRAPG